MFNDCNFVLIETLWNVKVVCCADRTGDVLVLIETLWNVKDGRMERTGSQRWCFNRNIVECKVFGFPGSDTGEDVLIETLWNVKE